jgi:hypothetical protein
MVAVLQDNRAVLTPVKLGRDYGSEVEIVFGLQATDSVILNPSDSLVSGAQVRVVEEPGKAPAAKAEAPKPAPPASPAEPGKKG